ncbi:MAG: papain-like cysteine protease family protein [Cyclobacteriaceae bacterium]
MGAVKLDFEIEPQCDSRLCWAAVSVSVARFYKGSSGLTQLNFAKRMLGNNYNRFFAPDKALAYLGNLFECLDRPLCREEIFSELKNSRPIAACMKHFVGWHLVVIYGIDEDNNLLIADSMLGNSIWSLQAFTHEYQQYYHWTHTYKTIRSV